MFFSQAGMNLTLFHACKAGRKSTFSPQWEVARIKQSLGSKNNSDNLSQIYAIVFTP